MCLVFCEDEKLLLEQRLDGDAFHKNWMFTGGKVEALDRSSGNPIHNASVREAEEETGLKPMASNVFTSFVQELRDGRTFEFIGVNILKWDGKLKNQEVGRRNLAWIGISEARAIIGEHEVDRRILEDFLIVRS